MKIRIRDDQKQVNWGIPGILNDEINLLQRYLQLKLHRVTFDPCCVSKG